MSEEQLCICGHPREAHHSWKLEHHFLASTAWPDEEGLWWSNQRLEPVWVYSFDGVIKLMLGGDRTYRDQQKFEKKYGPARFTKLLEENPFEAIP